MQLDLINKTHELRLKIDSVYFQYGVEIEKYEQAKFYSDVVMGEYRVK